jgi:hypothetical protein
MFFFYLDSQAQIHQTILSRPSPSIVDIDVQWLRSGHRMYPERLDGMRCFENLTSEIPEEHQFTYRSWYDSRARSTHCIWYAIPKSILKLIPDQSIQAKALPFVIHQFFPPVCRSKSVICFIDIPQCEMVVGYVRGHCVCFKKLLPNTRVNIQQEWQYFQQLYPQWVFDHSLYFTTSQHQENNLFQTHQHTVHLDLQSSHIENRMKIYGFG